VEVTAAPSPSALPLEFSGLQRPRPGNPATSSGCFLIGFAILWILISLMFMVFSVSATSQAQQNYNLLEREGQTAVGTITRLEKTEGVENPDEYTVYYRYPVTQNNRQITLDGHQDGPKDWFSTLKVGQAIDVIYARSRPQISQIKAIFSAPSPFQSPVIMVFGLIFVVLGLGILITAIKNSYDYLRLRSSGQETWATVFDRWQDVDAERKPTYAVAYAFKAPLPDGTLKLITRAELNQVVYNTVQIGGYVRVRYVPDSPDINRLVAS
jgi:hypothetical protein